MGLGTVPLQSELIVSQDRSYDTISILMINSHINCYRMSMTCQQVDLLLCTSVCCRMLQKGILANDVRQ